VIENKPFKDLKVIDLSSVLAGPSVGTFFAELGAHVLKIEHPKNADVTRSWKLASEDASESVSAYFSAVNYKKDYLSFTNFSIFMTFYALTSCLIEH
jgi:crotonobetainyl-CoA:carnitine CoA-transferase CaiB-like acyl-CoA transferase